MDLKLTWVCGCCPSGNNCSKYCKTVALSCLINFVENSVNTSKKDRYRGRGSFSNRCRAKSTPPMCRFRTASRVRSVSKPKVSANRRANSYKIKFEIYFVKGFEIQCWCTLTQDIGTFSPEVNRTPNHVRTSFSAQKETHVHRPIFPLSTPFTHYF